jgi:hypothetical protein
VHIPWKKALIAGAALVATASCAGTDQLPAALSPPVGGPAASAATRGAVDNIDIVGLVDGTSLVRFTTAGTALGEPVPVSGMEGDTRLVGIDFRVQDRTLYGVGEAGGLYSLTDGGGATKVGQLSQQLSGEVFGVDFNPAANALRIVSDTGQNLRQPFADPAARTAEDKALTNPAAPPATGSVPAEGVGGAGYTNNDTDAATATALFVLDTEADRLSIQSPANAGTLAPVGNLGVDAGVVAGFDVHSPVPGGPSTDMLALATLQVDDRYGLYEIDLLTGKAERLAELAGPVIDIAIPIDGG